MWSLSILIFFLSIWCTAGVLISAFMEYWYLLPFIQFVLVLSMTTITFLVCLMYLWCSHHSWSVSYLLCFTTAYLLSYTFNNLLTHLLRHTVIILSVISRLCHMWHHVHLSVPAGLRSAPVAHPRHALMPCCGRFNVLSGLLLPCCSMKRGRASALRRSTIRHPAVTVALLPPPPTRLPRTL